MKKESNPPPPENAERPAPPPGPEQKPRGYSQHGRDVLLYDGVARMTRTCHGAALAAGWWTDLETGESLLETRNHGELFMLMVSEIAEAMEGDRKNMMDDHLPHRRSVEVELADLLIRVHDFAGAYNLDLAAAVIEKLDYNAQREDHKPENRRLDNGKKY